VFVCVPTELASVSWSACTVEMLHACPVPPIDSWCSQAVCSHVTARETERVYVTRLCFLPFETSYGETMLSSAPGFPKEQVCSKVPRLHPFVLPARATCR